MIGIPNTTKLSFIFKDTILKAIHNRVYRLVKIEQNDEKKSNGENYKSPLSFYINQGFKVLYNKRIESDLLKAVKIKFKN